MSVWLFWLTALVCRVFLAADFFFPFSILNISYYFLWLAKFLLKKNQLIALWDFPYVTVCFSLAAFKILPLCLLFAILIIMCLGVNLLELISFWAPFGFWTWVFLFFLRLGKFSVLLQISFLPLLFSLFSFRDPYNINVRMFNVVPEIL